MLRGEFKINNLIKGLTNVASAIKNDPSLPILSCVLMESQEGGLRLATTNLEAGVNSFVRGKLEEEGSVCVPFKNFLNYISSLEGEVVKLEEQEKNRIQVISEKSKAIFRTQRGDDFPFQYELINKLKKKFLGRAKSKKLKEGIFKVVFAASKDETRPELCGVLFQFYENNLNLASTDSYRLSEVELGFNGKAKEKVKVIIPAVITKNLAYVLDNDIGEEVDIFLSENQILFELNNLIFTSRLTEGNYPEYKEVIPQQLDTEVILSKDEFARAIKRVGFFTEPQFPAVKIVVSPSKNQIEVTAENSIVGSSYARIEGKIKGDKKKEVSYNYIYLLEGLNNLVGEKMIFKTSGPELPGLFLSETDKKYLYVVMPIREE